MDRYVVTRNLGSYRDNGPVYIEYVCSFWASESDTQAIYPIAGKSGRYVIEKVRDINFLRENPRKVYNFQEKDGYKAAKEYSSPHEILEFINQACAKKALNDLHDEEEPVFTLLKDMSPEDPPFKTGETVYEVSFDFEDGKVKNDNIYISTTTYDAIEHHYNRCRNKFYKVFGKNTAFISMFDMMRLKKDVLESVVIKTQEYGNFGSTPSIKKKPYNFYTPHAKVIYDENSQTWMMSTDIESAKKRIRTHLVEKRIIDMINSGKVEVLP